MKLKYALLCLIPLYSNANDLCRIKNIEGIIFEGDPIEFTVDEKEIEYSRSSENELVSESDTKVTQTVKVKFVSLLDKLLDKKTFSTEDVDFKKMHSEFLNNFSTSRQTLSNAIIGTTEKGELCIIQSIDMDSLSYESPFKCLECKLTEPNPKLELAYVFGISKPPLIQWNQEVLIQIKLVVKKLH